MAMEDSGSMMSPADIAALTKGNGFGDGNGLSWLVLIILFFGFMGGGFGWNRNNGDYGQYATAATQQEILFGQQFGQINDRLTALGNGICSLGYDMQGNVAALGKDVALGQANLQLQASNNTAALASQLASCCCENRLATANLGAQIDRQTCDITSAIHAEGEQTRAMLQANEIQALRDKVASLELGTQLCGVVKYPMSYAYSAGASPFCGGGCAYGSAV